MILALITLGKMLESHAKGKTTSALEGLASLKGKNATLLVDGVERIISVDDVKIGDVLVVRSGESIPTDSEVIDGVGTVDESMLTGESIPRDVFIGDSVYGGTINRNGYMLLRATKVGEGTVLSGIINMVKEASSSKAPIAKMADKVSAVFVPSVILISLATLTGWLLAGKEFGYAIARAISVLVISCPCALGLATPVAIMVGTGVGARHGVLFKTATALEEAGRIETVVLDKTGTLTTGKPSVCDIVAANGVCERDLLRLAMSIEKMSEHPLGRAVVDYAEELGIESLDITEFKSLTGRGVSGKCDGKELMALSFASAFELYGELIPTELGDKLSEEGKTPLAFLWDGKYIGAIALKDTPKHDAKVSIGYIKDMGLKVLMLSGDNERTARAVASELGIDEVIAGVLPDGKESVIRELCKGGKVCMVGDGVNDAPSLTRADVGVAVGCGTDIAIDSADIVILSNNVSEVAYAIDIGRKSLKNIKQNLFWAFAYNCIGIPLAAGLFGLSLSPMIAAGMMSLSSFSVVTNALRLNLWRPRKDMPPCEENMCNKTCRDNVSNEKNEMENGIMKIEIKVDGMMCPHCEARVKKACESVDGVILATPSHQSGVVAIEMTRDVTSECIEAITNAGYDVV